MFKKFMAILLIAMLLFSCFCINASADVGDNEFWEVEYNDDTEYADRIYNDYTVMGSIDELDIDCFEFVITSTANITIINIADTDSILVGIWNSADEIVASAPPEYYDGSYATIITTTLPAGTYYILILPKSGYYYSYSPYLFYFEYTLSHTHYYSEYVTPATCTSQGYTTYICSCGDNYISNYTEYASHTYSNSCDSTCNVCRETRTISHTYDHGCDNECNICMHIRNTSHLYDSVNDYICNNCKEGITPPAPTVIALNSSAVELKKIDGFEYSIDGVNWQSSNIFTGLEENMQYTFYQRIIPSEITNDCEVSAAVTVTTTVKLESIVGDCNNDGKINTSDLASLKLFLAGATIVGDGADFNKDGKIDTSDLASLKLCLAGH